MFELVCFWNDGVDGKGRGVFIAASAIEPGLKKRRS
jgi:hypothetical protein